MLYIFPDYASIFCSAYLVTLYWWDFPHSEAAMKLPWWWRIPTQRQLQGYHNSTSSHPGDRYSPLGGSDKATTTIHPIILMMENPHSETVTRRPQQYIQLPRWWRIPTQRQLQGYHKSTSRHLHDGDSPLGASDKATTIVHPPNHPIDGDSSTRGSKQIILYNIHPHAL